MSIEEAHQIYNDKLEIKLKCSNDSIIQTQCQFSLISEDLEQVQQHYVIMINLFKNSILSSLSRIVLNFLFDDHGQNTKYC